MFCFCELRVVCGCEGIQSHPRQSSTTAILTKSTIQHVQNVVNFSKFFFLLFCVCFVSRRIQIEKWFVDETFLRSIKEIAYGSFCVFLIREIVEVKKR